mgnify:FL=1
MAELERLEALLDKTALVALSYFDVDGAALQQRMLSGKVVRVTPSDGITLRPPQGEEFTLPSSMSPWFIAPPGQYRDGAGHAVDNPDYLAKDKPEGEHQWWEWVANTQPPTVGS